MCCRTYLCASIVDARAVENVLLAVIIASANLSEKNWLFLVAVCIDKCNRTLCLEVMQCPLEHSKYSPRRRQSRFRVHSTVCRHRAFTHRPVGPHSESKWQAKAEAATRTRPKVMRASLPFIVEALVWFGSSFQMTTDVSFLNFANFI